jgi:predicted DNA-binding transcriptional regulator AlpA
MEFHPSFVLGADDAPAITTGSLEAEPNGLLTDSEFAEILGMTLPWVRTHAPDLPGFVKLGAYFRFHRPPIVQWLGGLDRLLSAEEVADLLKVPKSWVYANADQIPGVVRLGRYVRFRPAVFHRFLAGSEVAQ